MPYGDNELTSYLQSEADTSPVDSLSVDLKLGPFVLIMRIQDFYPDSKSPILLQKQAILPAGLSQMKPMDSLFQNGLVSELFESIV